MNYISEQERIDNLFKEGIKTILMYRINAGGRRLYCTTEPFKLYSGLTGALSSATFKGNVDDKRLGGWRDMMVQQLGSLEKQQAYLSTMGDFGTLVHECLVRINKDGSLDWKWEQEYAAGYFEASARNNGITPNSNVIRAQVYDYCKAAASLLQFVYENVVEIYSIEGMAKSDQLEIATPIDLTCKVKTKKGDKVVTLNLKTSNQIGDHQREQVVIEKHLWNETYQLKADFTGIVRTKDWRKTPTYEYELIAEEDEKIILDNTMKRLILAKDTPNSTYANFKNSIPVFTGVTKAGEAPKIEYKTLEEIFNENKSNN